MSIVVRNATRRFGGVTALDQVSLDLPGGSLTALLGPSGSGRSTLLRVIAGLERPDAGTVELDGRDVTGLAPQRRRVALVSRPAGLDPAGPAGGRGPHLALARALAARPRVLLLDEPFGGLDAGVRRELRAWLRRLHERLEVTTVLVTDDREEAMEVADRLVVMHAGRVEQAGTPRDLYEHPANVFVMGVVGQVTRLGEHFLRPHDLELRRQPDGSTAEAMVERLVHLGFEVRADLVLHDGQRLQAQLSREDAEELELRQGDIVFVRPHNIRRFADVI
jgi:sulfate transport system ATP-binding protein